MRFLPILLFVLTIATTYAANGWFFSVSIMTMLLAHELGHYFACRFYGVASTFPIFIPMPNLFGTMGAVIKMKSPIPSRKALFDIGVAGPLAGMVLAIPVSVIGIYLSDIRPVSALATGLRLGEPLLFSGLVHLIKGPIQEGSDLLLHPIAFAGWAVFFVTAMNLLPVGQLDGGHMLYAMFGTKRAKRLSWLTLAALLFLAIKFSPMWYPLIALILLFVFRHPRPLEDALPIGRARIIVGLLTFLLMIVSFSPVPIDFPK